MTPGMSRGNGPFLAFPPRKARENQAVLDCPTAGGLKQLVPSLFLHFLLLPNVSEMQM